MLNLSWFEDLDRKLRSQWLPFHYRHRVIKELRDHARDIIDYEDDRTVSQSDQEARLIDRLGDCQDVASSIVQTYRQCSFVGRHPILVFGASPLLLGPVLWVLLGTAAEFLVKGGFILLGLSSLSSSVPSAKIFVWIVTIICPLPIILLYVWLAIRYTRPLVPLLISTVLLAFFFGSIILNARASVDGTGRTIISGGLHFPPQPFRLLGIILTVCVFALVILYRQQRRVIKRKDNVLQARETGP
jgi:hypothetical protein